VGLIVFHKIFPIFILILRIIPYNVVNPIWNIVMDLNYVMEVHGRSLGINNSSYYIACKLAIRISTAPSVREIFGHNRVKILVFPSPIGSMLWSFGSNWGIFHRILQHDRQLSTSLELEAVIFLNSTGSSITTLNLIFSVIISYFTSLW